MTALAIELERKLDFWEKNLRANYDHYRAEGRPAVVLEKITAELGMIDAVRDVIQDVEGTREVSH